MKKLKAKITFINVGNGDSILVESYEENRVFTMLVDGGSGEVQEYRDNRTGRIRTADFLKHSGVDHLDVMVSTHIHEDHVCGLLPAAMQWMPKQLWQPYALEISRRMKEVSIKIENESLRKFASGLNDYIRLCSLVEKNGGCLCQVVKGSSIPLSDNLKVSVLGPDLPEIYRRMRCFQQIYEPSQRQDEAKLTENLCWLDKNMNDSSIILSLWCEGRVILLAGDTGCTGYSEIGSSIRSDVFKVGHHGQKNGLDQKLLEKIAPEYAVISASSDRRYESASPEVLNCLKAFGTTVLFTDCVHPGAQGEAAQPHSGVCVMIYEGGAIEVQYLPVIA